MKGYLPDGQIGRGGVLTAVVIASDPGLLAELRGSLLAFPAHVASEVPPDHGRQFLSSFLASRKPDLIVIEVTPESETGPTSIREARRLAPECPVIAVARESNPEMMLAALRAGCSDFVRSPVAAELGSALTRIHQAVAERMLKLAHKGGTVIGLLSAQGGCGASTLACHAAAELGRLSKQKVLLADLDLSDGNVGFLMRAERRTTLGDALANTDRLDASLWSALVSRSAGIDVIPSPGIAGFGLADPAATITPVLAFAQAGYRYVVADLGCDLNRFTDRALDGMDRVFIVATADAPALHQAKQKLEYLTEARVPRVETRVILNRLPKDRSRLPGPQAISELSVCCGIASDYRALYDAAIEGKLVPSGSRLGKDFAAAAGIMAGAPPSSDGLARALPWRSGWLPAFLK